MRKQTCQTKAKGMDKPRWRLQPNLSSGLRPAGGLQAGRLNQWRGPGIKPDSERGTVGDGGQPRDRILYGRKKY